VAGLDRQQGEFILTRLSTIIRSVGAPLGSQTCKPNFYVIVAPDPALLLREWWADGAFVTGLMDSLSLRAHPFGESMVNVQPSFKGSRLTTTSTRDIFSVIVVVDSSTLENVNFGQLADYVGLIGLAQIDLDKPLGDAPTILKLFTANVGTRPAAMTAWDRALLHGLYSTDQKSRVQTSQIETVALRDIESNGGK